MSFPLYPKYKSSGVSWFGDAPEHWPTIRYKNVFKEKQSVSGDALPSGSISFGRVVFKSDKILHELTKASYQEVLAGEFLINPINLNYDLKSLRTGLSDINTCVSPAYIVLRAKAESDKNYLKYQLHLFDVSHMKTLGAGVRQTITFGDIGTCSTCLPPLAEQTAIAKFLDLETGKIDGLVAEQRRLMELLKEKRQAVISHAVTKGLNPHAPMKPSGIEWLGEVPEHWGIWKLTHAFGKIGSGTTPKTDNREYYDEGTHPWVNTGDLNDGDLIDCEKKITDKALTDHTTLRIYPAGSVLIAMYGATIGKLAILQFPASVNQACCVFSGQLKIDYKFLFFWLLGYRPQIISLASGGGQPNVNQDILRGLRVACPELPEQTAIVEFLGTELAKFDTLTAEAQRAIDLLQERRAALISAAVTGQIDVRQQVRN